MMREENDKYLRSKIDSVEHVPDAPFNKDEAWQRLSAKLPAEKMRVLNWQPYGIAAGLLLFAVTAFYLLKGGGEETKTVYEDVPENKLTPPSALASAKNDTEGVIVKSVAPIKHSAPTKAAVVSPVVQKVLPTPEDAPVVTKVIEPVLEPPQQVVKAVRENTVAVHINELADEPIKQPEIPKAGFIGKVYAASGTSSQQSNLSDEDMQYGLLNLGINR